MYPKFWPSARLGTLVFALGLDWLLAGCGGTQNLPTKPPPLIPSITWATPAPIAYGTALSGTQLDATASVPGSFAYSPAPGAVLSGGSQTLSVTFTPTDTADYASATASVTIQVNPVAPALTWATPAAIGYGTALGSSQLDASSGGASGTLAYSPAAGTLLAIGSHTLSVTFTPSDSADYTAATGSVTIQVNQGTPTVNWATPKAIPYGALLGSAQLDATSGGVAGSFAYSPGAGTLLTAGSHTLTVTFTPSDSTDYTGSSASVTIRVNQDAPTLTWTTPASVVYGTALGVAQLNASSGGLPGTFAYSPAAGAVLGAGINTLSVTFTPSDTTDYAVATASVTLIVGQANPVLNWPTPAAISYGTPLSATQLDATANVPGRFDYDQTVGAVFSPGTQTLSVTFTPTETADYTTATASVVLIVAKAMPSISWVPAGTIAVGMPLTSTQLDATASVGGAFVYSPAAGVLLNSSGPQTLSATFTPTDQVDYDPAEATATLNVSPFGVVAWGDSLTVGDQGVLDQGAYPSDLTTLITLPVVNQAVPANSTTQIAVREGAIPTYATVSGGSIPATGGVTVTFPAGSEPVTSRGPEGGAGGTILGVQGLVTYDAGIYTFTRTTAGSPVSAPGSPQFVVDTPYAGWIPVLWEGRNDHNDNSWILFDTAAQVASVPSGQTYLVLANINANDPNEWIGGPSYADVISLNNHLANSYGPHYLDIRQVLVSSYDPSQATDVADFNHDEPPTSLRAVNAIGVLAEPIGPADTVLMFNTSVGSLGAGGVLTIGSGENAENAIITAVTGHTATVERDLGGANVAHEAGAPLTETDLLHLNAKGYQIVANAVAQFLSAYASQAQK